MLSQLSIMLIDMETIESEAFVIYPATVICTLVDQIGREGVYFYLTD